MREHQFWQLIAQAQHRRRHTEHGPTTLTDSQLTAIHLRDTLEERGVPDTIRFHRELARIHRRAYRWDLWTAFGIALGEIDEDRFSEAICWLILRGKRAFRAALVNPDTLAGFTIDAKDVARADKLAVIAYEILEPPHDSDEDISAIEDAIDEVLGSLGPPGPPPGEPPTRDLPTLHRVFPQLTARYAPAERTVQDWAAPGQRS